MCPWMRRQLPGPGAFSRHSRAQIEKRMIIDCHGHFTTAPKALHAWRAAQLANVDDPSNQPRKGDLAIRSEEHTSELQSH